MSNGFIFEVKWSASDSNHMGFEVVEFEGVETISQSYEFKINLRSSQLLKSSLFPIGHKASFTIQMENMHNFSVSNQKSTYHGIILEFSLLNKIKDYYYYKATLCPKLAKLKYEKKSDVYVGNGLGDILNAVFNNNGFAQDDRSLKFNAEDKKYKPSNESYNRYAFICQYQESDYNFVNRLLERDGIYYYFKQSDKNEEIIFTDNKNEFLHREKELHFRFLSEQTSAPDPNSFHSFELKHVSVPKQVTILNYNYEKANLGENGVIACTAYVSNDGRENKKLFGEEVIYGENFISQENGGDGKFLASIRAQEIYSHSQLCIAKSTAVPINAGMKIKLDDAKQDEFNGDYLVVSILHKGQQALSGMQNIDNSAMFYENTLTLLPADVQFRPRRITPWPKIYGTLNALIDGEQESSTPQIDATGRYKVRFPFLKESKADGNGSIWVRMATPYAGHGYGFNFPLVKGVEVMISFRDGNPDMPIIVNAVFNSTNQNFIGDANNYLGGAIVSRSGNIFVMNETDGNRSVGILSNDSWHYYK